MNKNKTNPEDETHAGKLQEQYERVIQKLEPYWPDLLHRGAIQKKADPSPTPTYILQFRQVDSGWPAETHLHRQEQKCG